MKRRWPQFASPGWLAAYVVGIAGWFAIYDLLGAVVFVAILLFGVLAIAGVWDWTSREGGKRS